MAQIFANGISLEYEECGPETGPAVLMIMGLGAQLVHWPDDMIETLAGSGYRVIRFDNRDVGLSHKFHDKRAPHPIAQVIGQAVGLKSLSPYTLADMATDAENLLHQLGIRQAHIVGVSMGGMIGQLMASHHPHRITSLTSIMSGTGNPSLPKADRKIARHLILPSKPLSDRGAIIDRTMTFYDLIGTQDPDKDVSELRARIEAAFDRCYYPSGLRRQIAAILSTGDFRPDLKKISAPTLVIHGSHDPLASVEGGKDSAANIQNAQLEIIEGMGHDLPKKFLPQISGLILTHMNRAEGGGLRQAAE